jgi:hypothetical protein
VIYRGPITKKSQLSITTAVAALVIIGVVLTLTAYGALSTSSNLPSAGTVSTSATLGVYSNSACTTSLTSLSWGTPTPGSVVTQTIYIKNTSTGLSLTLTMTTNSWSPASANGPITITWNQQNADLAPGQSVTAVLTLTVSSSISDINSFNVNICITGTSP